MGFFPSAFKISVPTVPKDTERLSGAEYRTLIQEAKKEEEKKDTQPSFAMTKKEAFERALNTSSETLIAQSPQYQELLERFDLEDSDKFLKELDALFKSDPIALSIFISKPVGEAPEPRKESAPYRIMQFVFTDPNALTKIAELILSHYDTIGKDNVNQLLRPVVEAAAKKSLPETIINGTNGKFKKIFNPIPQLPLNEELVTEATRSFQERLSQILNTSREDDSPLARPKSR